MFVKYLPYLHEFASVTSLFVDSVLFLKKSMYTLLQKIKLNHKFTDKRKTLQTYRSHNLTQNNCVSSVAGCPLFVRSRIFQSSIVEHINYLKHCTRSDIFFSNDLDNHLETTQGELDTIKEMLFDGYSLDTNALLGVRIYIIFKHIGACENRTASNKLLTR